MMNKGLVWGLWDYTAQHPDELSFSEGDALAVLRRSDEVETEWWWARLNEREGYVPRNLLGVRGQNTQTPVSWARFSVFTDKLQSPKTQTFNESECTYRRIHLK